MADEHLISASDLDGLQAVAFDGRAIVLLHGRLRRALEAAAEGLGDLLAEPALGTHAGTAFAGASWYTAAEGPAVALTDLPAGRRDRAEAALRATLARLAEPLADPALGPLLGRALVIPSLADVVVVGGRIVLRNWGFAPAYAAASEDALARHFAETLGRFCDFGPRPWASSNEAPAAAGGKDGPASRPPWYARHAVLAPLALLLASVGATVGYRSVHRPDAPPAGRHLAAMERIEGDIRGLQAHAAQLQRAAAGNVCRLDRPAGIADLDELGDRIDRALVLVAIVGPSASAADADVRRGFGAFLASDIVVTARAVIGGAEGTRVVVTSRHMRDSVPGRLIGGGSNPDRPWLDYAILKLDRPVAGARPLPVGGTPPAGALLVSGTYPALPTPPSAVPPRVVTGRATPAQRPGGGAALIGHDLDVGAHGVGAPLLDLCGRLVGVNMRPGKDDAGNVRQEAIAPGVLMAGLREAGVVVAEDKERCAKMSASGAM